MEINKYAVDGILPDKVFFFDLQPGEIVGDRGQDLGDKFEEIDRDFFVKARKVYLETQKRSNKNWIMIDAKSSIEEIQTKIYSVVAKLLGQPPLFK